MAEERLAICLAVITLCIYCIYGLRFNSPAAINPTGTLACKTYNTSNMDCSRRNLLAVPMMDKNWTTSLDLSQNQLKEIHGAPFHNLTVLMRLDLSRNGITKLSLTAFRGLHALLKLDMSHNKLAALSCNVFGELSNLVYLDTTGNPLYDMPGETLANLLSLQHLDMFYCGNALDNIIDHFPALTKLEVLNIYYFTNVTDATFHPIAGLSIQNFSLQLLPTDNDSYFLSMDETAFAPFTNVKILNIDFRALPALASLNSSLQLLILEAYFQELPQILDSKTLQVLFKFKESLDTVALALPSLREIEDDAFMWMPNVVRLIIKGSKIAKFSTHSFRGMTALQRLDLHENQLNTVPSAALNDIGKSLPLQLLFLNSNSLFSISKDAFSACSSVTRLDLGGNKFKDISLVSNGWFNVLQNLTSLVIGRTTKRFGSSLTIHLQVPHLSLKTIEIKEIDVEFKTTLCSTFPSLSSVVISGAGTYSSLIPQLALHKCSFLKALDLSGSMILEIHLIKKKQEDISVPRLRYLTLARNQLESIGQMLFIKAPNLMSLALNNNQIQTIDSAIAHAYKNLVYLNIEDNAVTSLAGLQGLTFLKHLKAARNQIIQVPPWLISKTPGYALMTLDLSFNPFHCSCDIEHFRK